MNYKEEAEKIVKMFMPYTGQGDAHNFRATHCAIKHVEGIINELDVIRNPEYTSFIFSPDNVQDGYERLGYWNELLNQLKQKLK